jgi:hypothetical protein
MNLIARLLRKFRQPRPHYSVDPLTGRRYALPDEVRNAFVPAEATPEEQDALDALGSN